MIDRPRDQMIDEGCSEPLVSMIRVYRHLLDVDAAVDDVGDHVGGDLIAAFHHPGASGADEPA